MFASDRGVVFSMEASLGAVVLLSILIALAYSVTHSYEPNFKMQQEMTVAHDLIVENSNNPPEGFALGSSCSGSDQVSKLTVSQYENWHAEVCMK